MAIGGTLGRVAWVDLDSGSVSYEHPPEAVYEDYLGGYGLGAYFLYTRQRPGVSALSSEATLGFLPGLLTGTPAITGCRFTVVGKSPKTGGWGDANCGGRFGPALKEAGLDGIFVVGAARRPVYLLAEKGEVTIHDASDYWGRLATDAEERLRAAHGPKAHAAVIGPAGESVRALAAIMNDGGRAAARSGLGMVMGSKRLKGVVAIGGGTIPLAREADFKDLRKRLIAEHCNDQNPVWVDWHTKGTNAGFEFLFEEGDTPVKNYAESTAVFADPQKLGGEAVKALMTRRYSCWKCPIGCGAYVDVPHGPFAGSGHKPEYETVNAFGPNCLNHDLEAICRLNNICNEYGMDTMSLGMTLSFALECYERGVIGKGDLDGIELVWGDPAALVGVAEQIARGEGFAAEVLGDGVRKAVERLGGATIEYAMQCGGEELGHHDPRCYPGIAASSVTDATPGRHTQGGSWFAESYWVPVDSGDIQVDKYTYGGKGEFAKYYSDLYHVVNMSGLCQFSPLIIPGAALPQYLTLATGRDFSMEDVLEIGERAANLRIAFNLREGIRNREAYSMPPRALGDPPLSEGPTKGVTVDNARQIRDYYSAMGWNPETGVPSAAAFERLRLDFALDVAE